MLSAVRSGAHLKTGQLNEESQFERYSNWLGSCARIENKVGRVGLADVCRNNSRKLLGGHFSARAGFDGVEPISIGNIE